MATKLRKTFRYKMFRSAFDPVDVEIKIVDWDDGTPLGYVWFGTRKKIHENPTYDFALDAKHAVKLAKAILAAAKEAGIKV